MSTSKSQRVLQLVTVTVAAAGIFLMSAVSSKALAVSASAQSTASPSLPTSGQFDQVTTVTLARLSLRIVQSITFKGGDIRVDTDDPSQMIPMTNIETPDEVYLYCPLMANGEKQPIASARPSLLYRMQEQTKATLAAATKTGSETCDGYACDTYSTTDNNGNENIKFWVSTDPAFPFTIKTVATDSITQKTTTIELQNINLNGPIDDTLFDVPTAIKFSVPPPDQPATASKTPGSSGKSTDTKSSSKTSTQ